MPLHFIGLGLNNEKDITINGLEAIKKCDLVYLENYTSVLNSSKESLEKFYNKKIILARRNLVEADNNEIIENAKAKNVAFLVAGDPLVATTHIDLFLRAKKEGIKCYVLHNASIISAIGVTGLQVYKFGKVTSIPFENQNVEAPYDVLKDNLSLGLHTLFLLDLNPEEETKENQRFSGPRKSEGFSREFMSINDAIRYLLKVELKRNEKVFSEKTLCVGCARIGSESQIIKYGMAKYLLKFNFGKPVHCLIVPGKLHFMEEEGLKIYS